MKANLTAPVTQAPSTVRWRPAVDERPAKRNVGARPTHQPLCLECTYAELYAEQRARGCSAYSSAYVHSRQSARCVGPAATFPFADRSTTAGCHVTVLGACVTGAVRLAFMTPPGSRWESDAVHATTIGGPKPHPIRVT